MLNFRLLRILKSRPRLLIGLACGIASYFLLFMLHNTAMRTVMAWNVGSIIYLTLTLVLFVQSNHTNISTRAAAQEEGEWSVFALTILGAFMSMAAILALSGAVADHKSPNAGNIGFVVLTLILSWLTTHVTFAYRYAHEYYSVPPQLPPGNFQRGIQFPGEENPDYLDFIYFSFVLGMTFQVSDTNITSKKFRRMATIQGLIGFLFNTVILALSVNIAAALI